jgi:hypothetical protein
MQRRDSDISAAMIAILVPYRPVVPKSRRVVPNTSFNTSSRLLASYRLSLNNNRSKANSRTQTDVERRPLRGKTRCARLLNFKALASTDESLVKRSSPMMAPKLLRSLIAICGKMGTNQSWCLQIGQRTLEGEWVPKLLAKHTKTRAQCLL